MQKKDLVQKIMELRKSYADYGKIDLKTFAKIQFKSLSQKKLKIPITLFQL